MIQSRGTFIWGLTCWELWSENSERLSFPWSNCSAPVRIEGCVYPVTATVHSPSSRPSEPGMCGSVHCIAWHGRMQCQACMCAQTQSCNAGAWYNTGEHAQKYCRLAPCLLWVHLWSLCSRSLTNAKLPPQLLQSVIQPRMRSQPTMEEAAS